MEALLAQLSGLSHWKIDLLAVYLLYQGVVFTIFPEEVITTTLGLLWSQGRIGFFEAMLVVQLGLIPADSVMVIVGTKFGAGVMRRRPFSWMFKPEDVAASGEKIRKYGKWVVFGTRFTPIVRGPVYFACGLSQMGILNFMKIDAVATCFHVPILLLLGGYIGRNASSMIVGYQRIGMLMAALLGGAIIYNIARRFMTSSK